MAYYSKAEQMYTTGNYENALRKLVEAEKLMSPNPKILYLKVNILNKLNSKSASYRNDLAETISNFFAITDKNTYPREKYMDIVGIKIDMDDAGSKGAATYSNATNNGSVSTASTVNIEDEYDKIKYSKKISDFETFLFNHKNSKYEEEIRSKFNTLKNEWNKKQELERQKLVLSTTYNSDDCNANTDNTTFTSVNGITNINCVLKGLYSYSGNIEIHIGKDRGRKEIIPFYSYTSSNSPICVKQNVTIKGKGAFKVEIYYNGNILVLQRMVYID